MTTTLPRVRRETLPEAGISNGFYANANNEGCEVMTGPCLECPLLVCVEDLPNIDAKRSSRNIQIMVMRNRGAPILAVARKYRVSTRTVYRVTTRGI